MQSIWKILFNGNTRKSSETKKRNRSRQLALEALERREMLSVGSLPSCVVPSTDTAMVASFSTEASNSLAGDYLGWEDDDRIGFRLEATGSNQYAITIFEDGLPGRGHKLNDDDRYEGTATYDSSAGLLLISLTRKVDDGRVKNVEQVLRNLTATVTDHNGQIQFSIPKNREWDRIVVSQTNVSENNPVTSLTTPNVKAKAQKGGVDLTWNAVAGATSYSVSRLNPDGKTWTLLNDNVTANRFTDSGLSKGTYTYSVKAQGVDGIVSAAKQVKVKVTSNTIDPPSVKAKVSKATVSLSWKAVSGAVSYTVSRLNPDGKTWTVLSDQAAGTSFTDSVSATGTYTYAVRANNAAGVSSDYKAVKAKVKSVGIDTPSVKAKAAKGTVALTWKSVPGASFYTVSRLNTDGKTWTILNDKVTGTSFTDTGLSKGTYTYAVRAVDGNGISSDYRSVKSKVTSGVVIDRILTGNYLGWEGDDRIGFSIGSPVANGNSNTLKYSIIIYEDGLPDNGHNPNDDDRYEGTLTYNSQTGKLQIELTKKFDEGREKKVESVLRKLTGTLELSGNKLGICLPKNSKWDRINVTSVS